jgi:hypothetical protein
MIDRLQALPFQKHHAFDQSSQVIIFVSGNTCSIENRVFLMCIANLLIVVYISQQKKQITGRPGKTPDITPQTSLTMTTPMYPRIKKSSMKMMRYFRMSRCHHYLHWSVLIISMHLSSIVQKSRHQSATHS